MSDRLLKRIVNAEVLGLLLVGIALQVLLRGVQVFLRGTDTDNLFWVCLAAACIGLALGKSRLNGVQASVLSAALGFLIVWILGARIAQPLFDLIRSIINAGPQAFPEIGYRFGVDASGISNAWNVISVSSGSLLGRWQIWLLGVVNESRVNDALIRNMLWTLSLWLLSTWIGWFAAKRNAMTALLPGIVLLTIITYNTERRVETLWASVFIMLLLMGIWNYKTLTHQWESGRIDYADSIRYDNTQAILVVAVIVGTVSFFTPSISWRDVRDYWRELERERERAQQSQTAAIPSGTQNAAPPERKPIPKASLPREHLLTAGAAQSETIVMTIKTGELPPVVIQNLTTNAPRYYWRSVIYDQYAGGGWYTTSAPPQPFAANEPMIAGVLTGYKLLHLNVQMQQPQGTIYWTGMLYSADIPLTIDWRLRPESSIFADQTALLQADMFAARTDATAYKVDAFVPTPSIEQLRTASVEYPEPIRKLYFSLPTSVPARVLELAQEITAGKETPYDKVKAIETYLRTNYPYDLEIGPPPADQDVADYFLFDLKKGYCDYYATAMAVLVRANGIPARFVSGYASGEYDAPNAQYVIRELHAHSWVEVYFPEIGWVEFEPTGSEPEIEREKVQVQPIPEDESDSITREILFKLSKQNILPLLIPVAMVIFVVLIYFVFVERMLFLRLAPANAIEILYKRLYRSGRVLAGERTRAETAYEFANKLVQKVQQVHEQLKLKESPHKLRSDVEQLTMIYQSALFRNAAVDEQDVKAALKLWNRLRWSLIVERIKHFVWMRNKITE